MQIRDYVAQAFLYKLFHLQKVTWNQNGNDVLQVKYRLRVLSLRICLLLPRPFLISFLPILIVLCNKSLMPLIFQLFCMSQIFHQPFEDFDVTVHTYVYVLILNVAVSKVLFKVLHILRNQMLFTLKFFVDFAVFIKDMYFDFVQRGALYKLRLHFVSEFFIFLLTHQVIKFILHYIRSFGYCQQLWLWLKVFVTEQATRSNIAFFAHNVIFFSQLLLEAFEFLPLYDTVLFHHFLRALCPSTVMVKPANHVPPV